MHRRSLIPLASCVGLCCASSLRLEADAPAPVRARQFQATSAHASRAWQRETRRDLRVLLFGGTSPARVPLAPELKQRLPVEPGGFTLEEWTLQTLPDRRVHVWLAVPSHPKGKVGAVLALHGHGGSGEDVVRGRGLYWYGRALAEMGYVVIAPDIGSHTLQHTNWTLMGERVWDALCCLDYLETRPEVNRDRLAVAGLSLGGETTMYVAALDERIKAACSSGWLTTIENMKQGHCPCWQIPGLEARYDFADLFACVAPRPLVLEVGEKERAPGGFPVPIARQAFAEIQTAYRLLDAEARLHLDVHPAGHIFRGAEFWMPLQQALGPAAPWSTEPAGRAKPGARGQVEALRRGEIARRCFQRALLVVDGWWALRDRETALFPRRVDQPVWAPQDNAADMLPFLFITAHYLAPERRTELMAALRSEQLLTARIGPLPDWYALTNRQFLHADADLARVIFGAAEYCKDGLVPMTEVMGRGPWTERMIELMDAIFAQAPVETAFGRLPTNDSEVSGDLLQALARLHGITGDRKYLTWAERIGDAYCLEILPRNGGLPPHRWDFGTHQPIADTLNLNDHGNEIIGGLAELYIATAAVHPDKARVYREPLRIMFQRLLEHARNPDGLWFNLLKASTAEPLNRETPDTWGYALSAAVTFGTAAREPAFSEAARQVLRHIDQGRYLDWLGADAYADSIEGALLLLNRFPEPAGFAWLERVLPLFLGKQQENGIVEGWYGDGNYARTAMMAGLYFTQGACVRPWRPDLCYGAVRDSEALRVAVASPREWSGRLVFDTARHRRHIGLPVNYPRLNELPEWFTVEPERTYRVKVEGERARTVRGADLADGLQLHATAGRPITVRIEANP